MKTSQYTTEERKIIKRALRSREWQDFKAREVARRAALEATIAKLRARLAAAGVGKEEIDQLAAAA